MVDCPIFTVAVDVEVLSSKSGELMGNAIACDGPPPGDPLKTEICRVVPAEVRLEAGTCSTKSVELKINVGTGTPFTSPTAV